MIGLYELVRNLDFNTYEPIVLFYGPNPYREKFEALGVKVIILNEQSPPTLTIVSIRDIAASLSRYSRWLGRSYTEAKQVYLLFRHDWPVGRRVARLIKAEGIDLVHHNNHLAENRETVLAAWLAGVPQVVHVRMLNGFLNVDRFLARAVNAFIYMSKAIEQLYCNLGIPPAQGQIIYDPFDLTSSTETNHTAELRAEFGLTPHDRLISNVGRLDWWKGQDYFVRAMAEVVQTHPEAKALIVGEPNATHLSQVFYQNLQQLVTDLNLSRHVIFTGFRADIPRIMAASDMVVHSSSEPEPFGRVIVEAMAVGRPVIATAAGGVLDIIEDRVNGLLVPPKNSNLMAQAIQKLLQNQEQARLIGQRAQCRVRECFSPKQHVTAVENIYQKILAR